MEYSVLDYCTSSRFFAKIIFYLLNLRILDAVPHTYKLDG